MFGAALPFPVVTFYMSIGWEAQSKKISYLATYTYLFYIG